MTESTIAPGKIYEDVFYHPCLCISVDEEMAWGISLIDGSYPRSCDLRMSGVRELSIAEAWQIKSNGPQDATVRASFPAEQRWWR
jgi:hypothetical protein